MPNVKEIIEQQYAERMVNAEGAYLKINLYKGYEVEGVARAFLDQPALKHNCRLESMMIGDSYLMTHLGRDSTVLKNSEEQAWFLGVILNLLSEVRTAIDAFFPEPERPLLMSDMPDGTTTPAQHACRVAAEMTRYGADLIKLEIPTDEVLHTLETLGKQGYAVVAHIGYAPQAGVNRRYGTSLHEALELFTQARRARDAGACALVLERVDENVSRALSANHRNGRLIYNIFSGRAPHGGQSLNVFDSVFMPQFKAHYFPPTACYTVDRFPQAYTVDTIAECMANLIQLTINGAFPKSPPSSLTPEEIAILQRIDPWAEAMADSTHLNYV